MDNTEKENLKILLKYWIIHNHSHSVEFTEWADKAKAMGEIEIAQDIEPAVEQIDKATALFSKSLKKINGKGQ